MHNGCVSSKRNNNEYFVKGSYKCRYKKKHNHHDAYQGLLVFCTHATFYYCPNIFIFYGQLASDSEKLKILSHTTGTPTAAVPLCFQKESSYYSPAFTTGHKSNKLRSFFSFLIKLVVPTTSVKRIAPATAAPAAKQNTTTPPGVTGRESTPPRTSVLPAGK